MKKIHKLLTLTVLVTMLTNSAYTQEYDVPEYDNTTPTAYAESSNITRISAYIPVAALILAAIFLSRADKKSRNHSSSSSSSGYAHSDYSYYFSYFGSGSYSYSGSYYGSSSH